MVIVHKMSYLLSLETAPFYVTEPVASCRHPEGIVHPSIIRKAWQVSTPGRIAVLSRGARIRPTRGLNTILDTHVNTVASKDQAGG